MRHTKFSMCLVLPSMYHFIPLIAAGALPFSIGKKFHAEAVRRDHECLLKTINKIE